MLQTTAHLKGFAIHATDGSLGTVDDTYFDDETWTVRYLTVKTGGWLSGRQVLISPISVKQADWPGRQLNVNLTMKQVQESPDINKHQPFSRQHEAVYNSYYGYPYYWGGPYLWGATFYPENLAFGTTSYDDAQAGKIGANPGDSHLRSTEAVKGYDIDAIDGEIGHVAGFVFDDKAWAIRYIEVATKNWWPGKKVLVSPNWVERVSWEDFRVYAALTRDSIKAAPEYAEQMAITRDYENELFVHYDRPPYWLHETQYKYAPFVLTAA